MLVTRNELLSLIILFQKHLDSTPFPHVFQIRHIAIQVQNLKGQSVN